MMESTVRRRNEKLRDQLRDLENEVDHLSTSIREIIQNCVKLTDKIMSLECIGTYLSEYSSVYCHLSKCTTIFSEFNCRLEMLLMEAVPSVLKQISYNTSVNIINSISSNGWNPAVSTSAACGRGEIPLFACDNSSLKEMNVLQNGKVSSRILEQKNEIDIPKGNLFDDFITATFVKNTDLTSVSNGHFPVTAPSQLGEPRNMTIYAPPAICNLPDFNNQNDIQGLREIIKQGVLHRNTSRPELTDEQISIHFPTKDTVPKCLLDNNFPKTMKFVDGNAGKIIRPLNFDRNVGAVHDVILSYLVSPAEFYVYVKCPELPEMDELDEMMKKFGTRCKIGEYQNPILGSSVKKAAATDFLEPYALGYLERKSTWARVKITDWRPNEDDDLVQVFFLDHGYSELLKLKFLQPMEETYKKYPIFLQKCYMPGISSKNENWSEEDQTMFELFTEAADEPNHLRIEVEENVTRADDALGVKLFLPGNDISINEKLVKYGVVKCARDMKLSPAKYHPVLSPGQKVHVKLTCLTHVNKFYCAIDYEKCGKSDIQEKIVKVINHKDRKLTPLDEPPEVGDHVIGKYEDNLWYRALVVSAKPDCYKLLFVDYGNTEQISLQDMRKMEREFLEIPFQMLECHLDNVELAPGEKHDVAVDYFYKLVCEGDMSIQIKSVLDDTRSVYAVRVYDKDGKDVEEKLLSSGKAVLATRKRDPRQEI